VQNNNFAYKYLSGLLSRVFFVFSYKAGTY
jgi:hypothetical protein